MYSWRLRTLATARYLIYEVRRTVLRTRPLMLRVVATCYRTSLFLVHGRNSKPWERKGNRTFLAWWFAEVMASCLDKTCTVLVSKIRRFDAMVSFFSCVAGSTSVAVARSLNAHVPSVTRGVGRGLLMSELAFAAASGTSMSAIVLGLTGNAKWLHIHVLRDSV